jgi:hypothetical protein
MEHKVISINKNSSIFTKIAEDLMIVNLFYRDGSKTTNLVLFGLMHCVITR